MAWVGARAFDSVGVTGFRALVAPFLVDSYELQDQVFAAGIPARMLEGLDVSDLTGIGVLPGPLRQMVGIDHPFTDPDDFEGAVVGTSGGDLAERTLRALGATPQMVPAETSLDGLDGLDYQLGRDLRQPLLRGRDERDDQSRSLAPAFGDFSDSDRFADLTEDQKAILREAANDAIAQASDATRVEEADGGAGLCSVDDRPRGSHRRRTCCADRGGRPRLRGTRCRQRHPRVPRRDPHDQGTDGCATGVARLPAGVRASRRRELRRSTVYGASQLRPGRCVAAGDPIPGAENYGSWVYVFHRGSFAFAQETDDACTWGYGTYSVDGDRVEWSFVDGGGITPNNAVNKPGEFFVFGWSRYRDTLTLAAVPGEISPTNFMVKPWRLTDEGPSTAVFGTRCPPPAEAIEGVTGEANPATSIDGTWKISLTRDELAAAGASDDEIADPISWGNWQLDLDSGEFAFVEPSRGRTTDTGTYVVDSDELTLTHDATQGGAVFWVRCSLYRDTLTLERIHGAPLAWTGLVADVWQRIE